MTNRLQHCRLYRAIRARYATVPAYKAWFYACGRLVIHH